MTASPEKRAPGSVTDQEKNYRNLFEQSPVASVLVNRDGLIVEFNRRAADLLLIDPELRSSPDLPGYVSQDYQTILACHLNAVFEEGLQQTVDIKIQICDGQEIPIRLITRPVEDDAALCQVTLLDTSAQSQNNKVLSHLAYYDQLTGLPNRLLFNDRLRWAIRDARRRNEKLAVMVIDLDNFKSINDSLGHDAGDLLLKEVTTKMLSCLRESDSLARMGGDEFTILMQHATDIQAASIAANRLLDAIRQPVTIMERPVAVSGSIGICLYPDDGDNAEMLLHNADLAMYRSKTAGRNCMAFFNENMRAALTHQFHLEHQLRDALRSRKLAVHYQPMIDSATFQIIGLEALLRWDSESDGILSAGEFLKTAENLGLCGKFSEWALDEACQQMKKWTDHGYFKKRVNFRMAVNLCSEQLTDPELSDKVFGILNRAGLSPTALAMELSEEAIRNTDPAIAENLKRLSKKGIALHLDDFSEGIGSLQILSQLPFDCLKIDRIITLLLMENPKGSALLDTLIKLSHILGLRVIAEGVENQQLYNWLKAHACDGMQGYYFCRPLPAVQLEMLLGLH